MPTPESWSDPALPAWARQHEATWGGSDEENKRKPQAWRATYLGMVACIDDNVGRILAHHEDTASPAAEWLRRVSFIS